jgi:hypothetical protein
VNDPICHPRFRSAPRPAGSFTSPSPLPIAGSLNRAASIEKACPSGGQFIPHRRAQRVATDDAATASVRER